MDDRPIGVFDSGLGGLTIVRALLDLLPAEHLIYFGDTARFPYGTRDDAELRRFSDEITAVLDGRGIKMLVVACNSASAAALGHLRARWSLPILGVIEPGVRAALEATRDGPIGVIGTETTIASGAYEAALRRLHGDVQLVTLACPRFVELVERGDTDSDRAYRIVDRTLGPLRDVGIDTLVLGCTHYPHLARPIGAAVGEEVVLVSSAEETAFEVRDVLERTGMLRGAEAPARRVFITSGNEATFAALGRRFLGPHLGPVEGWSWPRDPRHSSSASDSGPFPEDARAG